MDILSSELALESSEVEGVSEIMFEVEPRTGAFLLFFGSRASIDCGINSCHH
jgi:hypothetical protein